MLFYTSLFIASIFAALVILWAYHAIADAGSAIMKTMLPSAKKGPTSHLSAQSAQPSYSGAPTPWGWKSHETPTNLAKTHGVKPANSAGIQYSKPKNPKPSRPGTGWVEREERSELGGKAYKVTRKNVAMAEGFKSADRPWGW